MTNMAISHSTDMAMLDGIKMDVIDVPRKSSSSRNVCSQKRRCQMPRSPFDFRLVETVSSDGKARENAVFYKPPPQWEIDVAVWQRPNCM